MAIISKSRVRDNFRYGRSHFRFAILYVVVTLLVLLFLNLYCSEMNQEIFFKSNESSMLQKCRLAGSEVAKQEVLNPATAQKAIDLMGSLEVARLVITDQNGVGVYDSSEDSVVGRYVLFPEIVQALSGQDIFTGNYHSGTMRSHAATPVMTGDTVIGCVYIIEYDPAQGSLVQSLQRNIFAITMVLEILVIICSVIFAIVFSLRLRRIMISMRIIREGDYSHKVVMGGKDELAYLADEFNDLTDKLQISEKKRHQFVSDASHELKTPLASIKLLTDSILQNEMDTETIHEFVEDIGNEADRLNRLSQKLLSLSRVESQQDGDCEIVMISPTIHRAVRMISGIAEKNHIDIQTDLKDDCPILILEDDLYQIIFNLIENGIKYNVTGGKLSLSLHREEDNAILQVSDTGVGIPPDAIGHIFERFYRVDKARARKSGGSGLGLAIVKNLVERNNGTILVESTQEVGTTFTVAFPVFDTEEVIG